MSKKSLSKELLSAYFDDEVTADERAQVRRVVEQTPSIRNVLDDYAQLSENLKSLRQDVHAPGLREVVMAEIRTEATAVETPAAKSASRRWLMIAGSVMTVAAAGLLLLIWPAGPQMVDRADVATVPAEESSETTDMVLAGNVEPPASALAARDSEMIGDDLLPGDAPALAEARVRVASLSVESLLEQVAKDRHVPKPGDVVKYLVEVADETVWIPLTVVDVQMTADDIQVLLTNHGIESPVELEAIGSSSTDSNVVILVESDWEKVAEVVADLDSQGYGRSEDVTTSIAMQKVQIAQNRVEPEMRRQRMNAAEGLAASAPAEQPSLSRAVPASPPSTAGSTHAKSRSGPLHAQLSARVSDKDVHAFELRGRSIFTETKEVAGAARALAGNEEQESAAAEPVEPNVAHSFSDIYATPDRARVVFVIKKSK